MFSVSCELRVKKELIIDHNTTNHNQMAALSIGCINVWFILRIKNGILSYGRKCPFRYDNISQRYSKALH
jgi:hypothetical protein